MAVTNVYSDASTIQGYTSVASLIFRKRHLRPFEKAWGAMLRKYGLSHFHMTDCNAAGGEFQHWPDEKRDECARIAIELLTQYPMKGIAFTIRNQDFEEIVTSEGIMPNPVTLGVWATLFSVRAWADEFDPAARISYLFESGDNEQGSINNLMNSVAEDENRRRNSRYRTHDFVPKLGSFPTQAADILAWHAAKNAKRRDNGQRMRGDFHAIVSKLIVADDYHDRAWLKHLVDIAKKHAGKDGNRLAGAAFLYNKFNAPRMEERFRDIVLGMR